MDWTSPRTRNAGSSQVHLLTPGIMPECLIEPAMELLTLLFRVNSSTSWNQGIITGRAPQSICQFWRKLPEFPGIVGAGLIRTVSGFPAIQICRTGCAPPPLTVAVPGSLYQDRCTSEPPHQGRRDPRSDEPDACQHRHLLWNRRNSGISVNAAAMAEDRGVSVSHRSCKDFCAQLSRSGIVRPSRVFPAVP